jgi:hypothetical protein
VDLTLGDLHQQRRANAFKMTNNVLYQSFLADHRSFRHRDLHRHLDLTAKRGTTSTAQLLDRCYEHPRLILSVIDGHFIEALAPGCNMPDLTQPALWARLEHVEHASSAKAPAPCWMRWMGS